MITLDRVIILLTTCLALALLIWGMTVGGYPRGANIFPALATGGLILFGLLAIREKSCANNDDAFSWMAIVWLVGSLPFIFLFGFRIGLPLYALAYSIAHGMRYLPSTLLALGVIVCIEVIFVRILNVQLDPGWVVGMLTF